MTEIIWLLWTCQICIIYAYISCVLTILVKINWMNKLILSSECNILVSAYCISFANFFVISPIPLAFVVWIPGIGSLKMVLLSAAHFFARSQKTSLFPVVRPSFCRGSLIVTSDCCVGWAVLLKRAALVKFFSFFIMCFYEYNVEFSVKEQLFHEK